MAIRKTFVVLAAAAALQTAAFAAGPFQFHAVTPCRVVDTRNGTGGITGPLLNPGNHNFRMQSTCGVPLGAKAVTANFTVVSPSTGGDLRVFPSDAGSPVVSTLNYNAGEPALANGAIVPLATVTADLSQKDLAVRIGMGCITNGCGNIQLLIDVTGYFE